VVKNETGEIAIKITTTYYAGSFQTVEAQKKLNNFLVCKKDKIAIFPKIFLDFRFPLSLLLVRA
jgi:hypothetical protein